MPNSNALTIPPPAVAAPQPRRDSTLLNRNVRIGSRLTSLRLEPLMWDALEEVAADSGLSIHELCTTIQTRRQESSLTAAVRVFLLRYYRDAVRQRGQLSARRLIERALQAELT